MSGKEKPLPKPARTPFGQKKRLEEEGEGTLMADRLAEAAAGGRLEEFMKSEVPDNDYAKALVSMMMGLTGMTEGTATAPETEAGRPKDEGQRETSGEPSLDLPGALRKAQEELSGGTYAAGQAEQGAEKEIVDGLMSIARENGLSPDWVILRAIRLYIAEYRKTGRL